jgi:hypothetical protein
MEIDSSRHSGARGRVRRYDGPPSTPPVIRPLGDDQLRRAPGLHGPKGSAGPRPSAHARRTTPVPQSTSRPSPDLPPTSSPRSSTRPSGRRSLAPRAKKGCLTTSEWRKHHAISNGIPPCTSRYIHTRRRLAYPEASIPVTWRTGDSAILLIHALDERGTAARPPRLQARL